MNSKERQPGESIAAWVKRLINQNIYGKREVRTLAPAVVTAEMPKDPKARISALENRLEAAKEFPEVPKYFNSQTEFDQYLDLLETYEYPDKVKALLDREKDDYNSDHFLGSKSGNSIPAQLYRYWSRHWGPKSKQAINEEGAFSNKGTDIIDLSKNVMRVKGDTNQSTALFNEFVETDKPSIYRALDYQLGKISTIGDSRIPFENINLFAGIEDGKFKVDSLNNFNPSTQIYPARNIKRDIPLITKFNVKDLNSDSIDERLQKNLTEIWRTMPTSWKIADSIYDNYSFPDLDYSNLRPYTEKIVNKRISDIEKALAENRLLDAANMTGFYDVTPDDIREYEEDYRTSIEGFLGDLKSRKDGWSLQTVLGSYIYNLPTNITHIVDDTRLLDFISNKKDNQNNYSFTDSEGNEHPISNYNASILDSKMIFGNPNGGVFIGRVQDISKPQLDSLNNYLSKNPSWLIRPDLGSFEQYRTDNPTGKQYMGQFLENINIDNPNVFVVGTSEPNWLWQPEIKKHGGRLRRK